MKTFLTDHRREYLAGILAKVCEFIISLWIIGSIVSAKVQPEMKIGVIDLLVPALLAFALIFIGIIITPKKRGVNCDELCILDNLDSLRCFCGSRRSSGLIRLGKGHEDGVAKRT